MWALMVSHYLPWSPCGIFLSPNGYFCRSVHDILTFMYISAKVRGSRQKFGSRFLLHVHPAAPLGPQHRVLEPVITLETHLKSEQVKGRPNEYRYEGHKEET